MANGDGRPNQDDSNDKGFEVEFTRQHTREHPAVKITRYVCYLLAFLGFLAALLLSQILR
jgi:hypothetical protein